MFVFRFIIIQRMCISSFHLPLRCPVPSVPFVSFVPSAFPTPIPKVRLPFRPFRPFLPFRDSFDSNFKITLHPYSISRVCFLQDIFTFCNITEILQKHKVKYCRNITNRNILFLLYNISRFMSFCDRNMTVRFLLYKKFRFL